MPADSVVFRLPLVALVFPFVLACLVSATIAVGGIWISAAIVPLIGLWWFIRTKTRADAQGITAYRMLRRHQLAWADIQRLEVDGERWIAAIDRTGARTTLPMVVPSDLSRLQQLSDGKLRVAAA